MAHPVLALDIGGTKIAWGIVAADFSVLESGAIPTLAAEGGAAVAERIAALCVEILENYQARGGEISGIGIASAGVINPETGAVVSATDTMPSWGGTELGEILSAATGKQVQVINDVHAHGLGEAHLGAGRGAASMLSLAVGTGIGGALIVDGEIFFGNQFLAGHFGHLHHHYAAGQECSCGRNGHIEAICSGSGITAWYNSRLAALATAGELEATGILGGAVENGKELQERADAGEELAQACFTESGYALGEVLGSLANSVDPARIVLSGSMVKSGPRWWDAVFSGYRATAMNPVAEVPILQGELGGNAPLFGAVINFLNRVEEK